MFIEFTFDSSKLYEVGFNCLQETSIMHAPWPTVGSSDKILVQASQYLMDAAHDFRKRLKAYTATGKGKVMSYYSNF